MAIWGNCECCWTEAYLHRLDDDTTVCAACAEELSHNEDEDAPRRTRNVEFPTEDEIALQQARLADIIGIDGE